ncbi:hypothetical protein ACE7GA_01440 [Roseomonas sp. CCTCC AB2023176]|uniref:hypothetical protein n=1 Tax=Roseomonas sp. CCTCC AB2023176 TaxID=3342640 RepID=UPI0035DBA78C
MPDGTSALLTLASLADVPRWVAWQKQDRNGSPTKVPHNPATGKKAAMDAPTTWRTRAEAEARAPLLPRPYGIGGIGIALGESAGLAIGGIDLDTCRDPQTGGIAPWAEEVLRLFRSYAEVSPSGTGAKVFFTFDATVLPKLRGAMGTEHGKQWKRRTGTDHPPAIELYLGNRYFAVTDDRLPDSPLELRRVEIETILDLITAIGPEFAATQPEGDVPRQRQRRASPPEMGSSSGDGSRSAKAFKVAARVRRAGGTYDDFVAALDKDPDTAAWKSEKGLAEGGRELRRAWEAAGKAVEEDAPPTTDREGRPVVRVAAGELDRMTTEAEAAMVAAGVPVYQRGHELVRPVTREVAASHGRTTIAAGLGVLNFAAVRDVLCGVTTFQRFDKRSKDWVTVDPPGDVASILLSREGRWQLRSIAGVVTTPTLRPDGSLILEPGYDPATRLYHAADPHLRLTPTATKATPTKGDAEAALALLRGLLAEFPFVKGGGEGEPPEGTALSVALSACITPVVRGALSIAPMHAFRASTAGTGKSYMVDVASMIATGRPCPVTSVAPEEAETEKRLTGLLLQGFPVVSLDNVNGELGGDLLAQATERTLIRLRPLGTSRITEIENRACLFATGNNLRVRGDMVRRVLVSDLDAGMERPELRTFKADPVATVSQHRGAYVSAALTIVRAYLAAGTPDPRPPVQSYGDWSRLVRSALVWLGCADPAASMDVARADDPELGDLREMLTAWHDAFGTEGVTLADAADAASRREPTKMGEPTDLLYPDLSATLLRIAGDRGAVSTRRLAIWLRQRRGRIVDGRRFLQASKAHGNVDRWQVVPANR